MSTPILTSPVRGVPLVAGFRLHLADNWRNLHKRGVVIYSGAMGLVSAFGPILREAWHSMPDDLKAVVPANVQQAIAYTILFCTIIGVRYTSIRKAPAPDQAVAQ
jgi:DMSO/TMAO reductase YedYZ heme-binding membrane subunit